MQQEGIDFHNTFAPVANWSTVRLIIMTAKMAGRESRKIDYVIVFSQAPTDSDVYLHLPAGFHIDGEDENETHFLKLKNNLYGTRQSSANWFDMLKTGLEDEGFKQNKVDPCLFVRNNFIVICYVDDCCILSKDKETIDELLKNLSNTFNLTHEGGVKSYLDINFIKYPNGTITMIQPENVILTKDEYGNGKKQEWNYCSVIGHEYISLIQSMIDFIPLRHIMLEVSSVFGMKCDSCNSYTTTF